MKGRFLLSLALAFSAVAFAGESTVYIGTYTRGDSGSQGIYRCAFDGETGVLGEPELAVEAGDPSFLAIAPAGGHLYAVSEAPGEGGKVTAYRILESGKLEKIGEQDSAGAGPCHVSISPDGRVLALANYSGGSVASYQVAADGALSEAVSVMQHSGSSVDPRRQKGPHAHSINFSKDGRFAYAADLGTDRIYRYTVEAASGALVAAGETALSPGSGPRHLSLHPGGKFAYVINEMALTTTAFRVDGDTGHLTEIQTLGTLPEGVEKTGSTAEIVCHPSGRFLYGSNRGHDSIVVYRIEEPGGTLTWVENENIRGKTPRNFVLSPDGKWLLAAGQASGTVAVFAIDAATGALDFSGSEIQVPSPVCLRFSPQ